MRSYLKDGLSLIPELMDKACLRSNVLSAPVCGREAVGRALASLEQAYTSLTDIERTSTPSREIIFSRAKLPSGLTVTITVVGMRDRHGWISEIFMSHEPTECALELRRLLSA